jgi:hypothetical protein
MLQSQLVSGANVNTAAGGKRKAPDGSTADDSAAKRTRVSSGEGAANPKKGAACSAVAYKQDCTARLPLAA